MKGRKPRPTHLRLVSGTLKPRDSKRSEPKPSGDLFAPPPGLSARQKIIWADAIASAPRGLLKMIDGPLLHIWVIASDSHERAARELLKTTKQRKPLLSRARNGRLSASPYLRIMDTQAAIMLRVAGELGFSPAARTRIETPVPPGPGDGNDVERDYDL